MGLMQNSPNFSVMKILYFSNCEISYKQIRISQFGYELRINKLLKEKKQKRGLNKTVRRFASFTLFGYICRE